MSIMERALQWVCNIWFVLVGVNSAEMVLWNRHAYRIRPEYDEEGNVVGIKKIPIKITQFIKIPKRHGMMSAFLEGKVVPAILLDAIGATWRLDTEKKVMMVKLLNERLYAEWRQKVLSGKLPPTSSPQVAWMHPTGPRQPETLIFIGTPEVIGEYTGMDPYAQIERVNKALGPASTPSGWEMVDSSVKELKLLIVDEDQMNMVFSSGKSMSVEDGPVILKDYAIKAKPYVSDVGKILGVNTAPSFYKNLAFQVRVRGRVKIDGAWKRIIAKCNCNGGTEIVKSTCDIFGIPDSIYEGIDGVWRADNIKSKNVKPGQVVTIHVKVFEVAKTANVEAENSSSLGVQAVVGDQVKSRILHREHASTILKLATPEVDKEKNVITEKKAWRASIFRWAVFDRDLAANLHILIGDKKEISMADFKSISTAILCNGILNDKGKLVVVYTDSWINTLIPRWLRYLRDKVWTIQGSKYSQYIGAARVLKRNKSVMNELDELKLRHFNETGEWVYPPLPPEEAIRSIKEDGWRYVNRKKDPQTSALNLQGCTFCTRDENGVLQVLGNDLQEIDVDKMEFSGMPNAWSTPTSDEFGEDKDGDLLSILLSKLVHFGSHTWYFPTVGEGEKVKVSFKQPTTAEEWKKYFDYIASVYDGYAIAAKNTGMLDLETRLQCCLAIANGNLKDGIPFNNRTQRMFNYIREELGIKVSKHGLGGKTGGAIVEDPQELLRSLTYGEIEPKRWPQLFRATHKYGGVPVAYRYDSRKVLNAILKAILKAEKTTPDGRKVDFFLDYAFDIIRAATSISPKLQVPKPDRKGTDLLSKQYKQLFDLKKGKLSKGSIFTPQDVINFIGEKKGQGIRGLYADLSSGYQTMPDKSERYRALALAYTYLLSWYPYYRGVWPAKKILREFAANKYLRFKPIKELLYKEDAELTDKETQKLREKGWLDKGVVNEDGEFVMFEEGFLNSIKTALNEIAIETVATWLPKFYKIDDDQERIKQTNNFLMLCIIYAGAVGFGSGYNGETGHGYTKTATIMNYFKPELYVEVARMRYKMLGVECLLLDELPQLWEEHDKFVSMGGYTEEQDTSTEDY